MKARGLLGWALILTWLWVTVELWLDFGRLPAALYVLSGLLLFAGLLSWGSRKPGPPTKERKP